LSFLKAVDFLFPNGREKRRLREALLPLKKGGGEGIKKRAFLAGSLERPTDIKPPPMPPLLKSTELCLPKRRISLGIHWQGIQDIGVIELGRCNSQNLLYLDSATPLLWPSVNDFLLDIQMIDPHGKLEPL
jgi:hypothetical protein